MKVYTLWELRSHLWWNFKARFFWGPLYKVRQRFRK